MRALRSIACSSATEREKLYGGGIAIAALYALFFSDRIVFIYIYTRKRKRVESYRPLPTTMRRRESIRR